jgi:hypothetical protein
MTHGLRRLIPAFIIGVAIAVFAQAPVHADSGPTQAITVSPASTEFSIDPGASDTKSMEIINGGSDAFNVALTSSPYHVEGDNYDPQFTQIPGTVDASAWIHLSTTTGTVEANKDLTVPYTIDVPQGTVPGGYYAIIFATTSTDDAKTGVISHNRVGDILYITVNGTIKTGGKLVADPLPAFYFAGSIPIGTKISNSGGTHFITTAIYTVTDMNGKQVFSSTTQRYILPQTEREITATWTPQALFGIFTVHRSATISGNTESLPNRTIVVINPWLIVLVTFIIGFLIGIPVKRARQRRQTKEE